MLRGAGKGMRRRIFLHLSQILMMIRHYRTILILASRCVLYSSAMCFARRECASLRGDELHSKGCLNTKFEMHACQSCFVTVCLYVTNFYYRHSDFPFARAPALNISAILMWHGQCIKAWLKMRRQKGHCRP